MMRERRAIRRQPSWDSPRRIGVRIVARYGREEEHVRIERGHRTVTLIDRRFGVRCIRKCARTLARRICKGHPPMRTTTERMMLT